MNPYRGLFVVDDLQQDDAHELRGFAILLIVLGLLRIVPASVTGELITSEAALAILMLMVGIAAVLQLPRRLRRLHARLHQRARQDTNATRRAPQRGGAGAGTSSRKR
jgi:hypothetical protein